MPPFDYDQLDPGIRSVVRSLHDAGFTTTDSGDGVSKSNWSYATGGAIPFPHVVASSTVDAMVSDARRLAAVLGPDWTVEASYQTHTDNVHLFARTLDAVERS